MYQTRREGFSCIEILTNLPQALHCNKFRMVHQNILPMQAKDCQKQPEIIHTELEKCGLAIKIASFAHLLKKVDFDAIVDHLALTHIMKSKMGPVTIRIERLLKVLSSYSFKLYYIKGKDMILSNFLSRQKIDDSNPHEIITISFNMRNVLQDRYYNIGSVRRIEEKYLVQTRSQSKPSSIKLPEVHGVEKGINPHIQP